MRKVEPGFQHSHNHVDEWRDSLSQHLVAHRRSFLESRIGSCPYGIRWSFGDNERSRICGSTHDRDEA